jgi:hypothetical protein
MHSSVHDLIAEAESLSGRPIQVIHDAELATSAAVRYARDGASHHLVMVRPGPAADYFVANQVGFISRLFSVPAEERTSFIVLGAAADAAAADLVARHLPNVSADDAGARRAMRSIIDWVLLNVRSFPVVMRIDQRIFRDYPGLREAFLAGVRAQNDENFGAISSLRQQLPGLPTRYFGPAAAYAIFADRLLGGAHLAVPFEAMGLIQDGRKLMHHFDSIPTAPTADRQLIDAWAADAGVGELYRWGPYAA